MAKQSPETSFSEKSLRELLARVQSGELKIDSALQQLKQLPFEQLTHTTLDHTIATRAGILRSHLPVPEKPRHRSPTSLINSPPKARASWEPAPTPNTFQRRPQSRLKHLYDTIHSPASSSGRIATLQPWAHAGVIVIAAGTSDLPVAEEAALTLEIMGHAPERIRDVGVAGLHRLLHHLPALQKARVVVAVAGMEGALPSVIAGLIAAPVIAVPTSVGYGASFGGVAALLAMLNSCASGLAVVNIDNGFGAGYMAALINSQAEATP